MTSPIALPVPGEDFLRQAALSNVPKSSEDIYCLMTALGLRPAIRPTHPDHSTPAQMLIDLYFGISTYAIVVGSRISGKTRALSLLELLTARTHPNMHIVHVGAVEKQAKLAYGYVQEYLKDPQLLAETSKSIQSETIWHNGARLQILPGTMNAVSGPHPNMAVADEADQLDWDVYQQFLGMPHSIPGYRARVIITSALYYTNGVMARLMADAAKTNTRLYLWDVFDTMEPCDGKKGRPICEDALLAQRGIKSSPPKCPLWEQCKGRAMRATGHNPREDIIDRFLRTDEDTWTAQYLSQGVSRRGLVYPNWSDQPYPNGNVTLAAEYDPELPVYWGCDYGWTDPTVILLFQKRRDGTYVLFDEVYVTQKLVSESLDLLHAGGAWGVTDPHQKLWRGPYKAPEQAYVDSSAKELQEQIARLGIQVVPGTKDLKSSIGQMRAIIKDNRGSRNLLVHPRCVRFIDEANNWSLKQIAPGVYSDEPAPGSGSIPNADHALDAARYFLAGHAGNPELVVSSIDRFAGRNPYTGRRW